MATGVDLTSLLQSISFAGRSSGLVKTLRGFKKSFHSVPDAVNATTTAFVQRLAEEEMAEEGEQLFQRAKASLGYKRKELSLDLSLGQAALTAKDFVLEATCALSERDPGEYVFNRILHSVRRADFLQLPETETLFAGLFSEVVFALHKGAPVEQVIDAIENLDTTENSLSVEYPSNYSDCTVRVEGVEAEVRFSGHELAVNFPRKASPKQLWDGFLAVRRAFALSKDAALSGLVNAN